MNAIHPTAVRHGGMKAFLRLAAVGMLLASVGAAQVTVEKSLFFSKGSAIHDIKPFRADPNTTNILVVSGIRGIVLNPTRIIEREFRFRGGFSMRVSQNENEECIIFCTGNGSGNVFAANLKGDELWAFKLC